jgi:hypothetical protein
MTVTGIMTVMTVTGIMTVMTLTGIMTVMTVTGIMNCVLDSFTYLTKSLFMLVWYLNEELE